MGVTLSKFNNSWYRPGNRFKRFAWHYCSIVFFRSGFFPFYGLKTILLRLFGAKVGKGVLIKPGVSIKYPWFLEIGDDTWIGENAWIDNLAKVMIGSNVCISQGAYILTGNHNYNKPYFDLIIKEIIIEDGVWIGARSIVCPGVVCKSNAVLSVGSIAKTDLEINGIYQGDPAVKVRERNISESY